MRMIVFACVLLASASFGLAQSRAEPLKLPKEVKGLPGKFVTVKAETAGKFVRWRAVDPGLEILADLPSLRDAKEIRCVACTPGRYRVEAYTSINDEPTAIVECVVLIDTAPPDPGPEPPTPKPPAPPPVNPLAARLRLCFANDPGPAAAKAAQRIALIGLYEAMADHAKLASITTTGELLADLKTVANQMIAPGALIECRKVIAAEIAMALGDNEGARLDPDLRPRAVDVFQRIARAFSEVK